MTILQLRNHIPISGPARREPADGTETAMRVSLGFEPAWYHQRCGVDFSERWHTDPVYRHDTLVAMKAELTRCFPEVTYWDATRTDDTWTLSGVYGAYVVPLVMGCTLQYAPDRWPVIIAKPERTLEEWADLTPDRRWPARACRTSSARWTSSRQGRHDPRLPELAGRAEQRLQRVRREHLPGHVRIAGAGASLLCRHHRRDDDAGRGGAGAAAAVGFLHQPA